MKDHAAQIC